MQVTICWSLPPTTVAHPPHAEPDLCHVEEVLQAGALAQVDAVRNVLTQHQRAHQVINVTRLTSMRPAGGVAESDRMSNMMSDKMGDRMCNVMSDQMCNKMSDRMGN
jgi:hypothetical protein